MRPLQDKYDDEEASVALLELARMLKEVDTLISSSVWRLPQEVQKQVHLTIAEGGRTPEQWSNQIRQIAVELMDNTISRKQNSAPTSSIDQGVDPSDHSSPSL